MNQGRIIVITGAPGTGKTIYTDIRKLQDKAKTSYTLSTRRLRFGYE